MEKWGESFGGFEVVVYHGDTYSRKRAKVRLNNLFSIQ